MVGSKKAEMLQQLECLRSQGKSQFDLNDFCMNCNHKNVAKFIALIYFESWIFAELQKFKTHQLDDLASKPCQNHK